MKAFPCRFWNAMVPLIRVRKPQPEAMCNSCCFPSRPGGLALSLLHMWKFSITKHGGGRAVIIIFKSCTDARHQRRIESHRVTVLLLYTLYYWRTFTRNMKAAVWMLCLIGLALAVQVRRLRVISGFALYLFIIDLLPVPQAETDHSREIRSLSSNSDEVLIQFI